MKDFFFAKISCQFSVGNFGVKLKMMAAENAVKYANIESAMKL